MLSRLRLRRPRNSSPNHSRGLTCLGLWAARAAALLWAAAWIAFTTSVVWDNPGLEPILGIASGAVVLGPILLAWFFPRFGGLVLLGLGGLAWLWADSQASRVGLVVPGIGLGATFLALGVSASWQRWRTGRRALKIARRLDRPPVEA